MSALTPVKLPASANKSVPGVLAVIAVTIVGLAALDQSLARVEDAEMQGSSERAFQRGTALLKRGRVAQGLEEFRQAHVLERDNARYSLALIGALTKAGKTDEADTLMDEILARSPNDGEANLVAARLKLKEGNIADAEAYYHRAIYGTWRRDSAVHQRESRLELIKLLVDEDARPQLLGELIVLESEAADDLALQKQIAHLYLVAGSPARAATVYRELTERDPKDAGAYTGLGEAELERGEYRAARSAFLQASYHNPDASVEPRLTLLTQLTALDPTPRRLTSGEKYNRSLKILALAQSDLEARLASKPGAETSEIRQLLKQATDDLTQKQPTVVTNEMAERELDLAERIWKARLSLFGTSTSPEEEPLRLIIEHLVS